LFSGNHPPNIGGKKSKLNGSGFAEEARAPSGLDYGYDLRDLIRKGTGLIY
jgi:hypothetical protein